MELVRQAYRLQQSLYDQSMTAAIQGDASRSERLAAAAELALRRYERRHHALRGNKTGNS